MIYIRYWHSANKEGVLNILTRSGIKLVIGLNPNVIQFKDYSIVGYKSVRDISAKWPYTKTYIKL